MSDTLIKKIMNHREKINRIKFLCKKHEQLAQATDGIRSSIYFDPKEDQVVLDSINTVLRGLESKMLQKDVKKVHIDNLRFDFEPICGKCGHRNEKDSYIDTATLLNNDIACEECQEELRILPEARIV